MRASWRCYTILLGVLACGGPRLDTRTFQLKNLSGPEAAQLLAPYVFTDRKEAPGALSETSGAITVRETPDNLEKIARVLAQFDRPEPSVQLHFQVIEADGSPVSDPAIADVEHALRQLFRFKGYRLLAEAVAGGMEGSHVDQQVAAPGGPFTIQARILDVRSAGDSGSVRIETSFWVTDSRKALETTVTLRTGQTAVLGNTQAAQKAGTLILTVRPELVP